MSKPKVRRHLLGDGDIQIDGTVELMIDLAKRGSNHKLIRKLAKRLKDESHDITDYVQRCYKTVVDEIEYRLDSWQGETIEVVAAPWHTLVGDRKYGDCDCMVTALLALLLVEGVECMVKVVAWKKEQQNEFTHVYCLYNEPSVQAWIPMDPTAGDEGFGWEVAPIYRSKLYKV